MAETPAFPLKLALSEGDTEFQSMLGKPLVKLHYYSHRSRQWISGSNTPKWKSVGSTAYVNPSIASLFTQEKRYTAKLGIMPGTIAVYSQ